MKEEMEKMFRQSSESDIAGFRNLLDNINGARMKLEKDIKALNEELTLLKKNHVERCTMRKEFWSRLPNQEPGWMLKL